MAIAYYADIGITDYMDTLSIQHGIVEMRKEDRVPDIVLLTEHYPAILFGREGEKNSFSDKFLSILEKENTTPEKYLERIGVRFYKELKYGGGTAYVAPGQLVVYPINKYTRILQPMDVSGYKRLIDKTMLQVMHDFNIQGAYIANGFDPVFKRDRRDVWINIENKSHKIAAKGIFMGSDIAYHGFQLYVKKSGMTYFDLIHPCGYKHDQVGVISMEEATGREISMKDVKKSVLNSIKTNFQYDSIEPCTISVNRNTVSVNL